MPWARAALALLVAVAALPARAEAPVELTHGWEVSANPGEPFRPWSVGEPVSRSDRATPVTFRRTLPELRTAAPALFLRALETRCDFTVAGRALDVPQPDSARVPVAPWLLVRLPPDASGKLLVLRCQSDSPLGAGPAGKVLVGDVGDVLRSIAADDGVRALSALAAVSVGCLSLLLFARRREDRAALAFAVWALARGAVLLSITDARQLLVDAPALWQHALPLGRVVDPVALLSTVLLLFDARSRRRALRWAWGAVAVLAVLLLADVQRVYPHVWWVLNLEFAGSHVAVLWLAARAARAGSAEARAVFVALLLRVAAGAYELCTHTHLLPPGPDLVPFGDVLFLVVLGAVVLGRIAAVYDALRAHAAEVRAANERLRAAEEDLTAAVRARDDFLQVASHELRTPITALQLQLQVLRRAGAVDLPAALERVERQARRLEQLAATLLDVTRVQSRQLSLELAATDLAALARELATRSEAEAARAGSRIDVVAADPVVVTCDRLRAEQVLQNLLSNALKYGAGRPVQVRAFLRGAAGVLEVHDEGIGIAPEDQARIFDRFERAVSPLHYGGLGLGLWIARELVTAHGGSLSVHSTAEGGTTFTVELPVGEAAQPLSA